MDIYKDVEYLNQVDYDEYIIFNRSRYNLIKCFPRCLRRHLSDIFYQNYSRPIMLNCETINICTNNCIICPYGKMTREKEIMPLKLFEKVLHDYSDINGGYLSLTPKNGEIFLDRYLKERLNMIGNYKKIIGTSVTTNAIPVDRFSDSELKWILNHLKKLQISVYGLDEEEYKILTRKDFYSRMLMNTKRIVENIDSNTTMLQLGFRFLKNHKLVDIEKWIKSSFGIDIPYGYTYTYMNWNGALSENDTLPYNGKWSERTPVSSYCMLPLITAIVYSNGDVSYCPCNDFDISEEFRLGSIKDNSLNEIFNSEKNILLWKDVPKRCLNCSSHRPMDRICQNTRVFVDPVSHIGA